LWTAWVVVVAVEVVIVLVVSSAATGLSTWAVTGEASTLGVSVEAGIALMPAVLLVLAVSALLHAFAPRLVPLAWLLVGWSTVVGLLAETLRLPEWSRDLSPLHATGNVPIEPASGPALVVLALAAVLLVGAGVRRFARRDLVAG
jgi:ABC-2 type transport system permease protein